MTRLIKDENGRYLSFAWPGGYPIFYICADNGILCPKCANKENGSLAFEGTEDCPDDEQWLLVGCDVHYEGDPLSCDHCNTQIESAYGPVE